jgi:hypothetical protein
MYCWGGKTEQAVLAQRREAEIENKELVVLERMAILPYLPSTMTIDKPAMMCYLRACSPLAMS